MIKAKKTLIVVIMIILMGSLIPVFAEDYTFTLTVNPETTTAKLGDTISVDIGVADIDQTTQGINAIQGNIVFDEDFFESVDLVGAGNNWSVAYNKSEDSELQGTFVLSNMNNIKDNQVVVRLVAKIKSNSTLTSGKITLNEVFSSYGSATTDKQTKVITVNISSSGEDTDKDQDKDKDNSPIIDNNTITPDNSSQKNSGSSSQKSSQASSKTNTTSALPKAGIETWIGIVILAVAIVGIIEFIKYKKVMK